MHYSSFSLPPAERYFEDYAAGSTYLFGPVAVSEKDIVDFARQFDPQPFHTDPAKAAKGPFKGLIASGWHTLGLVMRLYVEHYLPDGASLGSPGVDEVRWSKPVRPGDELRLRITIQETKPSRSKPDRGMVVALLETLNQTDEVVASVKVMSLMLARTPRV